ncbi:hypothetical protein [Carboxylicivirga sp. N1Y90]|uniref:hypothetical protein n=1 Tax=Carboxylicivirga fragile TaxID=3417571 RepID=UPI003D32DEAF|nr:hypothetical protein [Marinilabiliaceae bacterium N1Y90]
MERFRAGKKIAGFLLITLLGSIITLNAQYRVTGEIIDVDNVYHDIVVVQKHDGSQEKIKVNSLGKFITLLEWNKVYHLSFKKPGYVSKVIEFSTVVPNSVHRQGIQPYDLPVRLFKVFNGVDTIFFKNPVAKIRYELDVNDFAADKDYSLNVKYRLEQMRKGEKPSNENQLNRTKAKVSSTNSTTTKNTGVNKNDRVTRSKDFTKEIEQDVIENEVLVDAEIIETDIPALKTNYPIGRTDEHFELKGRSVKRTIINEGNVRRVYFSVKHDWGGEYFFIDEAEIGCRCISEKVYHNAIDRLVTAKGNK